MHLRPCRPPPPKKHKKKPKGPPQAPSRQSSRLRGETSHADDEASELALFVINEACPRCGKVRAGALHASARFLWQTWDTGQTLLN